MRKLMLAVIVVVGLADPSDAATILWSAALDGSQEIPPNPSTATGFATVEFDDLTNILSLQLDWQGLTDTGIQAHIHCCVTAPPGNVGIALDLWLAGDARPSTGSYSASYDLNLTNPFRATFVAANGGTALGAFAALQAAMDAAEGRAYFNIHTLQFPGGEIRGNVAPAAVPEPASTATMLIGVAALALLRRITRA
jgi:hypothetical protein